MFSDPRFVAIDDREDHLNAITSALQTMGTSWYGIHFDVAQDLPAVFGGVRCLIVDLHLISSVPSTDEKTHFANLANIINTSLSPDSGPFILLVWTEHAHHTAELRTYLDTTLTGARPLAVLALPKENFINAHGATGSEALRESVKSLVDSIPQLGAVLAWESEVLKAAADTLASLLDLVPVASRTSTTYPAALDNILSRLACAAVGAGNVKRNPRIALIQALSPIITDRMSAKSSKDVPELWNRALTQHGEKVPAKPSPEEAARVNRMLHLAMPSSEGAEACDWGSVVTWPLVWDSTNTEKMLGVTLKDIFAEYKIKDADQTKCSAVLIRIGAVCDAAQNTLGPTNFLFAFEVPASAKQDTMTSAIWKSPLFISPDDKNNFRLQVHTRFSVTVLRDQCKTWQVRYRVREQLLMHLISAAADYASRPGVLSI